jgi:hypothetical protein
MSYQASARAPTEEDWVLMVRCHYCWAAPGEWCRMAGSGLAAPKLHGMRWNFWRAEVRRSKEKRQADGNV